MRMAPFEQCSTQQAQNQHSSGYINDGWLTFGGVGQQHICPTHFYTGVATLAHLWVDHDGLARRSWIGNHIGFFSILIILLFFAILR